MNHPLPRKARPTPMYRVFYPPTKRDCGHIACAGSLVHLAKFQKGVGHGGFVDTSRAQYRRWDWTIAGTPSKPLPLP